MIRLASALPHDRATGATVQELEQVLEELRASSHFSLRNVTCRFDGGVLVLSGRVESYYLKQMAQETVRRLKPDRLIANRVTVD